MDDALARTFELVGGVVGEAIAKASACVRRAVNDALATATEAQLAAQRRWREERRRDRIRRAGLSARHGEGGARRRVGVFVVFVALVDSFEVVVD